MIAKFKALAASGDLNRLAGIVSFTLAIVHMGFDNYPKAGALFVAAIYLEITSWRDE
jgi:hypothetical protein